jgi:hypothetical protein
MQFACAILLSVVCPALRCISTLSHKRHDFRKKKFFIIIIFLHGLGSLTCSGIDALPSFLGASTISSPSRFVVEDILRESGVVNSFKMVDPVLFVFGSHVLCSKDI